LETTVKPGRRSNVAKATVVPRRLSAAITPRRPSAAIMPRRLSAAITRVRLSAAVTAVIVLLTVGTAYADGRCNLNTLVGYQLIFAKPIASYVQGGTRKSGYEGCEPDRVLVFADNSGVRCKELVRQHVDDLPTGYMFARNNMGDLKLCVEGELFDVSRTN
jgi:hypothetical protein